jgi:predicted enzyme related to lactoylglutathione lyase
MPKPVHFEIHCEDVARARKFYGDVFGWSFAKYDASPAMEYWLIDTNEEGGMTGGLLPRPGALAPMQPPNAFVTTMGVASLDDYVDKCLVAGATVAMAKMAIPGIGWQAYLIDTEKNIFGLHQSDSEAK